MPLRLASHMKEDRPEHSARIRAALGARSVVLIGLMGAGKTAVGKRLAQRLDLPFTDADGEIEQAAGQSISEIFAEHGEAYFRQGERRVIARLLEGGPQVLATGGGAYLNGATRDKIREHGISVWLRAELRVLLKRVHRRDHRPLLAEGDPETVMRTLMAERYPVYAEADLVVDSSDVPHDVIVGAVIEALAAKLGCADGQDEAQKGAVMRDGAAALAPGEGETIIQVTLPGRSYPIVIGDDLIASAGKRLASALPGARFAVVSDANVAALYLGRLKGSFESQGSLLGEAVVAPGEASKSFPVLAGVCEMLLTLGVERGDCVIALGGGVVGDLAGLAASILRRGVRVVQMPTTLLAQVDSAIGGKTGIDTPQGKNLIGTFHQPSLVLADVSVLSTLSPRDFRAGYAEVAKYGLLGDAAFFAWLEQNWPEIFSAPGAKRRHAVETSAHAKAAIVEQDEREESGMRALLNLGHTFGHALEAHAGYSDRLLHGEAIAIGMCLAFAYSVEQGLCPAEDAARVTRHLADVGLPTEIASIPGKPPSPEELLRLMAQDKKVAGGKLALVLVHGIGQVFVERNVPIDILTAFLKKKCTRAA